MATYPKHSGRLAAGLAIVGLFVMLAASLLVPFAPTAQAATFDVNIPGLSFNPSTITISVGDTVRWTNNDGLQHTVTSDDVPASWTELFLNPLAQGSVTFNTAGVFDYHCRLHPSMTGTVIVQQVIPEFSSEFFVVIGLTAVVFGLMVVRRRQA